MRFPANIFSRINGHHSHHHIYYPQNRAAPSSHPFFLGLSTKKNIQLWGIPHFHGSPEGGLVSSSGHCEARVSTELITRESRSRKTWQSLRRLRWHHRVDVFPAFFVCFPGIKGICSWILSGIFHGMIQ